MKVLSIVVLQIAVCACSNKAVDSNMKQLAIAPSGNEFVFRYTPDNKTDRLVRFSALTKAIAPLPQPANEVWANPVFSPDGKWLAVGVYPNDVGAAGQSAASRIDLMRPDGSERHTVLSTYSAVLAIFSFSPDGRKLLYSQGQRPAPGFNQGVSDFDIFEVGLDTGKTAAIVQAGFYQLNGLGYLNRHYAYVGAGPRRYLGQEYMAPSAYLPDAPDERKIQWEMLQNSTLFVSDAVPAKLTPAVRFETAKSGVLPWQTVREIDLLRIAPLAQRVFVEMRDSSLPEQRNAGHYIRDIYEIKPDKTFHRLTHFNSVQYYGFDASADGRFIAVIPDQRDAAAGSPASIYRIDSSNGEISRFQPDFSHLAAPR